MNRCVWGVGIPANDYRHTGPGLAKLAEQLKQTLAHLHKLGWVHLDIRASNVVLWEPGTAHEWYLVDCEYALPVGELVPNKRYTGPMQIDQQSRSLTIANSGKW